MRSLDVLTASKRGMTKGKRLSKQGMTGKKRLQKTRGTIKKQGMMAGDKDKKIQKKLWEARAFLE